MLGISACAQMTPDPNPQIVASPDKATMMLAQAADRASVSMETLAAVEQARSPEIAVAPIGNAPPELRRAMTVNWVGPVEPICQTLADRAGYKFEVIGEQPPVPLVISLNVENTPVIDILRNVGLQMGQRADLKVDGTRRTVEVHYAPVTANNGG